MRRDQITPEMARYMSPEDQIRFGLRIPSPAQAQTVAGQDYIYGLELQQQKLMKDWLERHEYAYTWSRTDKKTRGILGTPDFTVTAFRLALEFKQPGREKLSKAQEIWRARHLNDHGIYEVVTSFEQGKAIVESLSDERRETLRPTLRD